jgi:hypothetical protein
VPPGAAHRQRGEPALASGVILRAVRKRLERGHAAGSEQAGMAGDRPPGIWLSKVRQLFIPPTHSAFREGHAPLR